MGTGKVHETLLTLVADLTREGIDYALVGAMALNAHGYRRETVDIDVLVTPQGLESFRERCVGRGYVPKFSGARKQFKNTQTNVPVEFLTTGEYPGDGQPKPVVFPEPSSAAIDVDGIKVISLPMLINLKLASGMTAPHRRRDLADVQDLIRIVGLRADYAGCLSPFVQTLYLTLAKEVADNHEPT